MSECILCDIAAGKAPASFVYQDDMTLAFMDIYSLNTGQVVVIPKKHFTNLLDADEDTGLHLFRTTMRVCQAICTCGIKYDGINLFQSNGEAAGQDVFHLHFLIVPRLKGDSMKITAKWNKPERRELDEIAARIRKSLQQGE